ncbi:MAG TPA: copper transporter [Chloroflexota bacterium]|nr:copper transporter [Chloroflexota bacterium]
MINLRYHIVSLIAVFLALGTGVVMGATVIDRAIVDSLDDRVNRVERSVRATQDENQRLNGQLQVVRDFADQARDAIARDQLRDVPVLVLAVEGVDRKPVDALRQSLLGAQASLVGTVWFTAKMRLESTGDVQALATALNTESSDPEALRKLALDRVATTLAGRSGEGGTPNPLPALDTAGFVTYDSPPPQLPATLETVAVPGLRTVLVSGAGARVGDDVLAVPLAESLVSAGDPVVAAEAGQDTPGGRGVFVGVLRRDNEVGSRLSTVDNLESSMGQAAAVLAAGDLGAARTGHFGVGPGAQRLLPAPQT